MAQEPGGNARAWESAITDQALRSATADRAAPAARNPLYTSLFFQVWSRFCWGSHWAWSSWTSPSAWRSSATPF